MNKETLVELKKISDKMGLPSYILETICELDDIIQELREENQQLKKQKDDVVKVLKQLKGSARWERHLYEVDYILDTLKGDSE